jgi:hypothetical protein
MDLTIEEYAKKFKMSKEMVTSKIKQEKLNFTIKDGVTMIIVPDDEDSSKKISKQLSTPKNIMQKATVATVLGLYKRENTYLKEKIEKLEAKIDKLIDDKEKMLKDERDRIEGIYVNKDEQLRKILELVSEKINQEKEQELYEIEHSSQTQQEIVELKEYLKTLDLKSAQRKNIKKRFQSALKDDVRIIEQNGRIYLDFSKYDYSDLLSL